jgi:hypothetical protein
MTACRYRTLLGGVQIEPGKYTVLPSTQDIAHALTTLQTAVRADKISPVSVLSVFADSAPS